MPVSLIIVSFLCTAAAQITPREDLDKDRFSGTAVLYECTVIISTDAALDTFFSVDSYSNVSSVPFERDVMVTDLEREAMESDPGINIVSCSEECESLHGKYMLWCLAYCQGYPSLCPEVFCDPKCASASVLDENVCVSRTDDLSDAQCAENCVADPGDCNSDYCTTACMDNTPRMSIPIPSLSPPHPHRLCHHVATLPTTEAPEPPPRGRCGPDFQFQECNAAFGECCSSHGW